MDNQENSDNDQAGDRNLSWQVPEYDQHQRGLWWYVIAALLGIGLIAYGILTNNFLFAILIILFAVILILQDARAPRWLDFNLLPTGVGVGSRFYHYSDFVSFTILYRPDQDLAKLYLDFKNAWRPRLIIPLYDNNPLIIRSFLLKYLKENLERDEESWSEILGSWLKF